MRSMESHIIVNSSVLQNFRKEENGTTMRCVLAFLLLTSLLGTVSNSKRLNIEVNLIYFLADLPLKGAVSPIFVLL